MSTRPIDPDFHPGYGYPPPDPHRLTLTGGPILEDRDAYHITGTCSRCSWTADSVAPDRQAAQSAVTREFLAWHHIGGIIDQTALEGMPRPLETPWYRDRRITGALAAIAALLVNVLFSAWRWFS